jgi:group II intron reverse transcriptase/maturase
MLKEALLTESGRESKTHVAYGVDPLSAQAYEQHREENLRDLVERRRQKRDRATLVKRPYLPKGNGQLRPLGLPAGEDKLRQVAVPRLLEALDAQEFRRCSYGYRPGVGAVDAGDQRTVKLQFGRYPYVVAADSKGVFDTRDHDWRVRMLAERIEDQAFLGVIRKGLQAGILDTTGASIHRAMGTPHGRVVSPVRSNVYRHYVLDLWLEKGVKPQWRGEAGRLRYADDYSGAFESQAEAEGCDAAVGPRREQWGLTLAADKTRLLPFRRHQPTGQGRFEGLGVEWYWGRDRGGKAPRKRRTARPKLWASLQRVTPWCQENRPRRLRALFTQ